MDYFNLLKTTSVIAVVWTASAFIVAVTLGKILSKIQS